LKKSSKEKNNRIAAEIARLNEIFINLPEKSLNAAKSLIENAAFMAISLDDLQEIINQKGYTEEYQNGANQKGVKKSSEVEIYNTMIKNHASIIKQLTDLIPAGSLESNKTESDPFEKIAGRGKSG